MIGWAMAYLAHPAKPALKQDQALFHSLCTALHKVYLSPGMYMSLALIQINMLHTHNYVCT